MDLQIYYFRKQYKEGKGSSKKTNHFTSKWGKKEILGWLNASLKQRDVLSTKSMPVLAAIRIKYVKMPVST